MAENKGKVEHKEALAVPAECVDQCSPCPPSSVCPHAPHRTPKPHARGASLALLRHGRCHVSISKVELMYCSTCDQSVSHASSLGADKQRDARDPLTRRGTTSLPRGNTNDFLVCLSVCSALLVCLTCILSFNCTLALSPSLVSPVHTPSLFHLFSLDPRSRLLLSIMVLLQDCLTFIACDSRKHPLHHETNPASLFFGCGIVYHGIQRRSGGGNGRQELCRHRM